MAYFTHASLRQI